MVMTRAAAVLRQPRAGRIAVGGPADLVVIGGVGSRLQSLPPFPHLPAAETANDSRPPSPADVLLAAARRDVRIVIVAGRPLIGDPDFAKAFQARRVTARPLRVDAAAKLADSGLARRIAGCPIAEPGVFAA